MSQYRRIEVGHGCVIIRAYMEFIRFLYGGFCIEKCSEFSQ